MYLLLTIPVRYKQGFEASSVSVKQLLEQIKNLYSLKKLLNLTKNMRLNPQIVSNLSNIGSNHDKECISETMLANFEKIIEEKNWEDPYNSIGLKLGTIVVYIIEGRHSSINI